jgi:hypothetical protein
MLHFAPEIVEQTLPVFVLAKGVSFEMPGHTLPLPEKGITQLEGKAAYDVVVQNIVQNSNGSRYTIKTAVDIQWLCHFG